MATVHLHPPSSLLAAPLTLQPPPNLQTPPLVIQPGKPAVLGRSSECDVPLLDATETISRRHAELSCRAGRWIVRDLGSRHGTTVNGVRIGGEPVELQSGDLLAFGPLAFSVYTTLGATPRTGATSIATRNDVGSAERVLNVQQQELRLKPQVKLDLLLDGAGRIAAALDQRSLAEAALETILKATGYPRGAVVKPPQPDGLVQVIASRGPAGPVDESALDLSRSLLLAAAGGRTVRFGSESLPVENHGQSILSLSIHTALCMPICIDGAAVALLYLDARASERRVDPDAPAFCAALARLMGLAMGNLLRAEIHARQREAQQELNAARQAQELIMPPGHGAFELAAGIMCNYAMHSVPGRCVSGDLFDIFPLASGKVAVVLGDVVGKGAGSALLMAAAQSYLHAALARTEDPGISITLLGGYVRARMRQGYFITLMAAVIDPVAQEISVCDAGHSYWLCAMPGQAPALCPARGGPPVGVDAELSYASEVFPFPLGSRLVVYSDGVDEQPVTAGGRFGRDRVQAALPVVATPQQDVNALVDALKLAAGFRPDTPLEGVVFDDDVTIASVHISDQTTGRNS